MKPLAMLEYQDMTAQPGPLGFSPRIRPNAMKRMRSPQ